MDAITEQDIDAATLALIRGYYGRLAFERRSITIEVFNEYGETDWTLEEFLGAITAAVAKVPEALRATATVALEGDYEETTSLKISFERPETDQEYAERTRAMLSWATTRKAHTEADERELYARLKAKYAV